MASQVAQNALVNPTGIPVANQTMPKEGPVSVPLGPFNFSVSTTYNVDLTTQQQLGRISVIQNLFIDNSGNTSNCVVTCQQTGQSITAAPLTQGYYPILAVQPIKFQVTSAGAINFNVVIYANNIPIPPAVWSGLSGASALLTQPVSDAILDATVNSSKVNTLLNAYGNADVIHALHVADSSVSSIITTAATTTLLTGSPSFFLNWFDISISEDATLSVAGRTTIALNDTNGPTVIWSKSIWIPAAGITAGAPQTVVGALSGLNWNSKGAASKLTVTLSTTLATGALSVNCGCGITSDAT